MARSSARDFSLSRYIHLGHADSAVVDRLEKLRRINSAVVLGDDLNFSVDQADIDTLNARLASEVLLHPVSSKISSHSFDAHFDVLDLRARDRHNREAHQDQ